MTPVPDRRTVTLANWRTHPASIWSFQNVRELVPTAEIGRAGPAEESADAGPLDRLRLDDPAGGTIAASGHFARSHADSVVVVKDGRLVAEWHAPHVDPRRPHVIFSVSKSVTGLLAGIAAEDGTLDPKAAVSAYVPVPAASAYATARVRDLLDMTVSLDFDEEYLDADGPFDRYRRAMLWNPERAGSRPETMREFLGTLPPRAHPHGERFFYASPDTDMLGLVLEAATGRRFHDFLAERLWRPLGATGAAYVTVDREGTARAAGGICVTPRDLARLGQLVLDEGRAADGRRIVPASWIADMRGGGDRDAWTRGNFADMFPAGRYRSSWYDVGDGRGSLAAVGIHGQWIWADPASRVVIARTASRPEPSDDADTQREIAILSQIARLI